MYFEQLHIADVVVILERIKKKKQKQKAITYEAGFGSTINDNEIYK